MKIIDKAKKTALDWKTGFKWVAFVKAYLVILGIVTFPLFINEEAVQVAQGGTWAAKAAKDWETMKQGCDLVDATANTLSTANTYVGWLNPWGYAAYEHYAHNSHYYAKACRKQAEAGNTDYKRGNNGSN